MPLQFDTLSSSGLRRLVRDFRRALVETGQPSMPQHAAQEVVARQLGHESWHAAHQQALRVDRAQANARMSAVAFSPVMPSSTAPSGSAQTLTQLSIVDHTPSPQEQVFLDNVRQGMPVRAAAEAYFRAHRDEKARPRDVTEEGLRLALALATTEGPWIHSWHVAPEAKGKYVVDFPDYRPDDTAFRALVDGMLLNPPLAEGEAWLVQVRQEIDDVLAGIDIYRASVLNYASRGQIKTGSPALAIFADPYFAYQVDTDVGTAAARLQPIVFDPATSSADRLGILQRLVDQVAHAHPLERVPRSQQQRASWEVEPVQVASPESISVLMGMIQIEPVAGTLQAQPALRDALLSVLAGSDRQKADKIFPQGARRGQVESGPMRSLLESSGFQAQLRTTPAEAVQSFIQTLTQTPQDQWVATYQRLFDQTAWIQTRPEQAKKGVTLHRLGRLTLEAANTVHEVVQHTLKQLEIGELQEKQATTPKTLGTALGAQVTSTAPARPTPRRRPR